MSVKRRSQYVFASFSKVTPLFLLVVLPRGWVVDGEERGEPAPEQVHGVGSVRDVTGVRLKSRGNYKTDCQLHNNAYNLKKNT